MPLPIMPEWRMRHRLTKWAKCGLGSAIQCVPGGLWETRVGYHAPWVYNACEGFCSLKAIIAALARSRHRGGLGKAAACGGSLAVLPGQSGFGCGFGGNEENLCPCGCV